MVCKNRMANEREKVSVRQTDPGGLLIIDYHLFQEKEKKRKYTSKNNPDEKGVPGRERERSGWSGG